MSHHSEFPFSGEGQLEPQLENVLKKFAGEEGLGATGEFPRGHLTKHDEGEIKLGVTVANNTVILNFGRPTAWIGFSKLQAYEIAQSLMSHADRL